MKTVVDSSPVIAISPKLEDIFCILSFLPLPKMLSLNHNTCLQRFLKDLVVLVVRVHPYVFEHLWHGHHFALISSGLSRHTVLQSNTAVRLYTWSSGHVDVFKVVLKTQDFITP